MTLRALLSLNALRSFASSGRHLSFTAAADELGVTQGAVSRLVRSLEQSLGVTLIRRQGAGLELTAPGAAYHKEVTVALHRISAATRTLVDARPPLTLVLDVLPTLGMRWLVPRLAAFRGRYPDLVVEVVTGDGPPDPSGAWALAIRYGAAHWPGLDATLLLQEEMAVVCAPALAAQLGKAARLPPRHLLQHTTRPHAWAAYYGNAGAPPPDLSHAPGFEHVFMLAEAALRGQGYALLPLFLVTEELAAGRLVCPFPDRLVPEHAYYILSRPGPCSTPLRALRAWLQEAALSGDQSPARR